VNVLWRFTARARVGVCDTLAATVRIPAAVRSTIPSCFRTARDQPAIWHSPRIITAPARRVNRTFRGRPCPGAVLLALSKSVRTDELPAQTGLGAGCVRVCQGVASFAKDWRALEPTKAWRMCALWRSGKKATYWWASWAARTRMSWLWHASFIRSAGLAIVVPGLENPCPAARAERVHPASNTDRLRIGAGWRRPQPAEVLQLRDQPPMIRPGGIARSSNDKDDASTGGRIQNKASVGTCPRQKVQ